MLRFHGDWATPSTRSGAPRSGCSDRRRSRRVGEAYLRRRPSSIGLRGELDAAEAAYREAQPLGPAPGARLALLRLAQGDARRPRTMIGRALEEATDDSPGSGLLRDGGLSATTAARREPRDERGLARAPRWRPRRSEAPARATGSSGSARRRGEGRARRLRAGARRSGRSSTRPYDLARVRVRIGPACRALGDDDCAALEFAAARRSSVELGAAPDLAPDGRDWPGARAAPGGLSAREAEVLRSSPAAASNRAIATALGISERTVDRHVSNIYTKLDVSSRAAATAFAYEHDLSDAGGTHPAACRLGTFRRCARRADPPTVVAATGGRWSPPTRPGEEAAMNSARYPNGSTPWSSAPARPASRPATTSRSAACRS